MSKLEGGFLSPELPFAGTGIARLRSSYAKGVYRLAICTRGLEWSSRFETTKQPEPRFRALLIDDIFTSSAFERVESTVS